MGADFVFSLCRIPGLPQDEFEDAVTKKITDMTDGEYEELLATLENRCLWMPTESMEQTPKREVIVEMIVSAERSLANGGRDMGSLSLDDKDYYISGLLSYGEGTESMEYIDVLVVTGFEMAGHEHEV